MGFAEQLATRTTRAGSRCSVRIWYDTQPPDVRSDFDDALEDTVRYTAADIARLISAEYGADIAGNTLARHRRGECRCA
jgi:hypothetical protein